MSVMLASSMHTITNSCTHTNMPLTTAAKQSILTDMGRCIAALHDGGLTHGDLRPSHCLLRQEDNAPVGGRGCVAASEMCNGPAISYGCMQHPAGVAEAMKAGASAVHHYVQVAQL